MKARPLVLALFLAATPLRGADQPPDPIAGNVFPPELVMKYQAEIGLSDAQRETLKAETLKVQGRFQSLQWDLQAEVSKLAAVLKPERVDEARALAALGRVLDLEREIKTMQITLLVRIKNALTREQQVHLAALRERGN
jgi:Spy/CpxP family protein refolding chaperone